MKKSIGKIELIHPNPVLIIGTYDKDGNPNVMNAAWGGIVSGDPCGIGISIRPSRLTHDNLIENKAFTVNIASADFLKEADYFGIVSGRDVNKFEKTGLTSVKSELVNAPLIDEFHYSLECTVTHTLDLNSHTLFIGEIQDCKLDPSYADNKGMPDWDKIKPLTFDYNTKKYTIPGEKAGQAFSDGLKFK